MDPVTASVVPCVFCCRKSLIMSSFRSRSENDGPRDVLHAILGMDKDKEKELESLLKEPFKGLPLCGDCDLIYIHVTSLVVHLRTIQEKIGDLSKTVAEKVVSSAGRDHKFLIGYTGNGNTSSTKVIRDNCRTVRNLLRSKRGELGGVNVYVSSQQGSHLPLDVQTLPTSDRLQTERNAGNRNQDTGEQPEGGIRIIGIKSLASLQEVETESITDSPDHTATFGSFPDSSAYFGGSSSAVSSSSVPKPSTVPSIDDDTSTDSDLFRIISRPIPLRNETIPCPGRKTKGCMLMFATTSELTEHVMSSHTSINTSAISTGKNISWLRKCYFCSLPIRNHKEMRRHLRVHTREAPYFCRICLKDKERDVKPDIKCLHQQKSSSSSGSKTSSSYLSTEELRRHLTLDHQEIFKRGATLKEICEEYRTPKAAEDAEIKMEYS